MPAEQLVICPLLQTNDRLRCKLCDEFCPGNIELGEMLKEAKRRLHRQDKMPGAYHQFWINDMEFSNSVFAAALKKAPGQETCTHAFFTGCHLGAADPLYVSLPYKWLLSKNPKTGLLLRCCGVPADWAGNEELLNDEIDHLRSDWERLGKPVLILACPSCRRHFAEYLPEIETVSLYEMLEQYDFACDIIKQEQAYSVFDACSARNEMELQNAVRSLAKKAGISLEELPRYFS